LLQINKTDQQNRSTKPINKTDQQNRLKSNRGPFNIVTGNQGSIDGLHISNVNGPTPSLAQAPIASLVERTNRFTSPDNSTLAPAFDLPISNDAPGMGRVSVNVPTMYFRYFGSCLKESPMLYIQNWPAKHTAEPTQSLQSKYTFEAQPCILILRRTARLYMYKNSEGGTGL
jgi:hypothetical protein